MSGPPRKFDWDEARRLRSGGLTYADIARSLGVSKSAICNTLNPAARARSAAATAAWQRQGRCPDCGGQTTRHRIGADLRCRPCAAVAQATTVREDGLQCLTCREWKHDEAFPNDRRRKYARRGRHNQCRDCLTEAKREWRARNRARSNAYDRAYKARKRQERAAA